LNPIGVQTLLAKNMFWRLSTAFVVDGHICELDLTVASSNCWKPSKQLWLQYSDKYQHSKCKLGISHTL